MTAPQFFAYPGQGELLRSQLWYSQSVRIGDRIEISGQGGWSPTTGTLAENPLEELDQAFSNVDLALRDAGGKGWEQVYKVRMYVVESMMDNEEFLGRAIENLKKWMPGHQPLLTAVGVSKLGAGSSAGMKVEIEVEAWDPRGRGTS
ncbi:Endoribonuclease L-PSP/chorismate mutase-like protein [Podospora aff. communis PSN243]|uniref:Endoribonuclease L-PSP/chorismate mutase-like protein n=1 Tax=Podospora aff. communis PSN243 TaxID=3040156 RepID=A0AAV9GAY4_9PEZI|nr:Endoribonuclease L-PSP/chorismate mutase-like protein [Podospora aff. communis PSN243]